MTVRMRSVRRRRRKSRSRVALFLDTWFYVFVDKTTNDIVAPWWNVPYEEQTSRKEKEMRQVLKRCNRRINRKDHEKDKKKKKTGRAGTVDQPCRDFMSKGSCMYGDRCKYIHLTLDEYEERLKKEQEAKENLAEETTEVKEKTAEETTEVKENLAEEKTSQEASAASPKENSSPSEQPAKEASDSEDYEKADEDEGQICSMLPILTHSKVEGYRNKCTFTIGKDRTGAPCIGFRMGSFINGNVIIGPVEYFLSSSPFTFKRCRRRFSADEAGRQARGSLRRLEVVPNVRHVPAPRVLEIAAASLLRANQPAFGSRRRGQSLRAIAPEGAGSAR